MKSLIEFVLAGMLFLGILFAPAVAGGDIARVMTQNQYRGADQTPIIGPETPEEFLAETASS